MNPTLFFNGSFCVPCYHPKYFDFVDNTCKSCTNNQIYNLLLKKCVPCPLPNPYFDGKQCSTCPQGTVWSAALNICQAC